MNSIFQKHRKLFILIVGISLLSISVKGQLINEILGRPTDSSITISFLTDKSVEAYWEYGVERSVYPYTSTTFFVDKNTPLENDLTGLLPNTRYYYRIRYRLAGTSGIFLAGAEHTFHTQRAMGSTYVFTIESDEHLYDKKGIRSIYKICLENQANDSPDFMFSLGDIFGDDHYPTTITSAQMDELHKDYRQYLGNTCHSAPLFICLGNHEGEKDFYLAQTPPENIAVYATLWRKFYYPNPYPNNFYTGNDEIEPFGIGYPENYYAWVWGDALFVVLDMYRDQCDSSAKPKNWEWTLGEPQYNWFKKTLENSKQKIKFVFAHHTRGEGRGGVNTAKYFEWGGYEADGETWGFHNKRPGWAKPIHQLMVDNGVNIFFQGHDHLFSQEILDGVVYQEVPMPSDSTYELGVLANADAYTSNIYAGSGHIRVTVSTDCVKVDFVRAYLPADTLSGEHKNAEIAFSYSLGDCSSSLNENPSARSFVKIMPNPASDHITVLLTPDFLNPRYCLFNLVGQKILETSDNNIDISHLKVGVYILSIKSSNKEANQRIIISR